MGGREHDSGWRPVPVLPYADAEATRSFWTALGFRVSNGGDDSTPYWLAVREGAELHFRALPDGATPLDPAASGYSCYLAVAHDLDALHAEWSALDVWGEPLPRLVGPEDKPWGLREMTVLDPAGTEVRLAATR